jgi:hypothetical protein
MTTNIQYNLPRAALEHLIPQGFLADTPAQHALWYFLRCAHSAVHRVPRQIIITGEEDQRVDLRNIARSIALAADVTLSEMFSDENYRRAKAEAASCRLKIDHRIATFIETGGGGITIYERDPDSHSKGN